NERITKIGHSVKCDVGYLLCYGIEVRGPIFDSMVAHSLIEPEMRHTLDYLAETRLGYCPISAETLFDAKTGQLTLEPERLADYANESADLARQLKAVIEPLLQGKGQERVF